MASEEAVVTPTASTGLFAELSATPRRAITEPDYIYLEQSMLDWLRAFKGSIARADYGPRIIAWVELGPGVARRARPADCDISVTLIPYDWPPSEGQGTTQF